MGLALVSVSISYHAHRAICLLCKMNNRQTRSKIHAACCCDRLNSLRIVGMRVALGYLLSQRVGVVFIIVSMNYGIGVFGFLER